MKLIHCLLVVSLGFFSFSCSNSEHSENAISTDLIHNPGSASGSTNHGKVPVFKFEKENHDFGTITQGEKVSYSFKFTNSGKSDLIISNASASCGCTVPNYPKKPIAPGREGVIDVVFDSEGKSGKIAKTITVMANTDPASNLISISGNIVVPKSGLTLGKE